MPAKKYSRKREAILQLIRETKTHPSAEWIYRQLKPEIPDLSLGTVYRNIAGFKKDGLVQTVCVVGGEERIDGDTHPHAHFVCRSCGCVTDVPISAEQGDDADLARSLEEEQGFLVEYYDLIFHGVCDACRGEKGA